MRNDRGASSQCCSFCQWVLDSKTTRRLQFARNQLPGLLQTPASPLLHPKAYSPWWYGLWPFHANRTNELTIRRLGMIVFQSGTHARHGLVKVFQFFKSGNHVIFNRFCQCQVVCRKDEFHAADWQPRQFHPSHASDPVRFGWSTNSSLLSAAGLGQSACKLFLSLTYLNSTIQLEQIISPRSRLPCTGSLKGFGRFQNEDEVMNDNIKTKKSFFKSVSFKKFSSPSYFWSL